MKKLYAPRSTLPAFTLVEMLVALTVFSIIALSVSSVFRSGIRTWKAGNEWSEENQAARAFFRQVSKELINVVNDEPTVLFEGEENKISFMTLSDELALVVYHFDKAKKTLGRRQAGQREGFDIKKAKEEPVAEEVNDVRFEYAFKPVYESDTLRWKKEWKDEKNIPRGVRIHFDDFHTAVFIPTGSLGDESALLSS